MKDIPQLAVVYVKPPVEKLVDLYSVYPEGGERGWIAVCNAENRIAKWDTEQKKWVPITGDESQVAVKESVTYDSLPTPDEEWLGKTILYIGNDLHYPGGELWASRNSWMQCVYDKTTKQYVWKLVVDLNQLRSTAVLYANVAAVKASGMQAKVDSPMEYYLVALLTSQSDRYVKIKYVGDDTIGGVQTKVYSFFDKSGNEIDATPLGKRIASSGIKTTFGITITETGLTEGDYCEVFEVDLLKIVDDMKAVEAAQSQMQSSLSTLNGEIYGVKLRLANAENAISDINAEDHPQSLPGVHSRLTNVEGTVSELTEEMEVVSGMASTNKEDVDALKTLTEGHTQSISGLTARMSACESSQASMASGLSSTQSTVEGQGESITSLDGRMEQAEAEMQSMSENVSEMQESVSAVKGDIESLEAQQTTMSGDVDALKTAKIPLNMTLIGHSAIDTLWKGGLRDRVREASITMADAIDADIANDNINLASMIAAIMTVL